MPLRQFLFLPLAVLQAFWVAYRAARLPEADGPREGRGGSGPALHLLILGDSSAAGVGVVHQRDALAGQLVHRLSRTHMVTWQLRARSGATAATALEMVRDGLPEAPDLVVLAIGVNDVKNGVPIGRWRRTYAQILDQLCHKAGARCIVVSGIPPLRHFPLLPWPLNEVLGQRAEAFDAALQELARGLPQVVHIPMAFDLDVSTMAEDGFHPGPEVFAEWAARVVQAATGAAPGR